mgnify:CR=1 FL=1
MAKTGSMYFVSGLAGYYFSEKGNYAFVILLNEPNLRKLYEQNKDDKYLIELANKWQKAALKQQAKLFQKIE